MIIFIYLKYYSEGSVEVKLEQDEVISRILDGGGNNPSKSRRKKGQQRGKRSRQRLEMSGQDLVAN